MSFETIFVYGSLKRGFDNHSYLEKACFLACGTTCLPFTMYTNGRYPNLVLENGTTKIAGELYIVDEAILSALDVLEDEYKRNLFQIIRSDNGEIVDAWLYHNENRSGTVLPSGQFEG